MELCVCTPAVSVPFTIVLLEMCTCVYPPLHTGLQLQWSMESASFMLMHIDLCDDQCFFLMNHERNRM